MAARAPRSSLSHFGLSYSAPSVAYLTHADCRRSILSGFIARQCENRLLTPADFADVPSADPFEGYEVEEVEDTPVSRSRKLRLAPRRRRPTRHAASLPWQRIGTSPDERHQHLCRPGNHEWCLRPDRAQIWTMGPQDRDYFLIRKRQEEAAAARSRGSVRARHEEFAAAYAMRVVCIDRGYAQPEPSPAPPQESRPDETTIVPLMIIPA